MISYHQLISQIVPGSTLTLREYTYRRGERRLTLTIENSLVHDIIPANVHVGREQLEQYYGSDLEDMDYLQLSSVNCLRVVLLIRVDENSNPIYKPIFINQDFYEAGLQEVELINSATPEEPVYAPQMLGHYQPVRVPIKMEEPNHGETYLHFSSY